jgi:type III secretory pathway component EscS
MHEKSTAENSTNNCFGVILQTLCAVKKRSNMSREAELYQSLASCGAILIAFIGVCHEYVGQIVFPWGPSTLGGAIGWHGLGIFSIVLGLLLLSGTLRLIRFPVIPWAIVASIISFVVGVFTAIMHQQFHMFAFAVTLAAAATAVFHRKASKLVATPKGTRDSQ